MKTFFLETGSYHPKYSHYRCRHCQNALGQIYPDYRDRPWGKALKVSNNKEGFENILTTIKGVSKQHDLSKVILGLEPTGHYWKPLGPLPDKTWNKGCAD